MSTNYFKRVEIKKGVDTLNIMAREAQEAFNNNHGVEFYQDDEFKFDYDATAKNDTYTEENLKDPSFDWNIFVLNMLNDKERYIDDEGVIKSIPI